MTMVLAIDNAGYVFTSWALVLGAVGLYAARLVQRGRSLGRRVPADRRRWMTSPGDGGGVS